MSEYNPFALKNKKILVTGATSGIGQAIAVMASKMGAIVVATGRNEEKLHETMSLMEGEGHKIISADLTKENDILHLTEMCDNLDGVVHSAGISDRTLSKGVMTEDIDRVMGANFDAPVLLQGMLLRKKKIKQQASIIFIASRAPFSPNHGQGLYAASKGALIAYSKVLGLELAPKKIRVNCICPAMVWTALVRREEELFGIDYSEVEKKYPLKRLGQPEDVAALAVYMLSDTSSWMTGSCVDLTGGGEFTLM